MNERKARNQKPPINPIPQNQASKPNSKQQPNYNKKEITSPPPKPRQITPSPPPKRRTPTPKLRSPSPVSIKAKSPSPPPPVQKQASPSPEPIEDLSSKRLNVDYEHDQNERIDSPNKEIEQVT